MDKEGVWGFIGDNLVSLATVLGGLAVLLFQIVNPPWFDVKLSIGAILSLLVLLATSELTQRSRSLSRIEKQLDRGFEILLTSVSGGDIKPLHGADDFCSFMDRRVPTLTKSFDSVRLNKTPRASAVTIAKHN